MDSDWKFGQWPKVANNLKVTSALISLASPSMLQDFCLCMTFGVTTVNVTITTDKYVLSYMFVCTDLFLLIFVTILVDSVALICTYVHSLDLSCDYKDSVILNIVFPFHDHNFIICLVLSYLVNLRFPFMRSFNCSFPVRFTHFVKCVLSYIYLHVSASLSLAFHLWLLTLFYTAHFQLKSPQRLYSPQPTEHCLGKEAQSGTEDWAYHTFIVLSCRYCAEVFFSLINFLPEALRMVSQTFSIIFKFLSQFLTLN